MKSSQVLNRVYPKLTDFGKYILSHARLGRSGREQESHSCLAVWIGVRLSRVNSLLLWGSFYLTGLKSLFEFLKPFNLKSPGRCAIGFSFKLINKIGLCLSLLHFVLKKKGLTCPPWSWEGVELLVPMNPCELSEGWESVETGVLV